jgi:peptidoglycan/LPS O-acetylase OafA/YrhL
MGSSSSGVSPRMISWIKSALPNRAPTRAVVNANIVARKRTSSERASNQRIELLHRGRSPASTREPRTPCRFTVVPSTGMAQPMINDVEPHVISRFEGLDGLRTIAVFLVVWHNYGDLPGLSRHPLLATLRAGYVGVTLFFVLSGFLITYLLLGEFETTGRIRLGSFYVRRAIRLFPALGLTLVFLNVLGTVRGVSAGHLAAATLAAAFYFFNFVEEHASYTRPVGAFGWSHLWSLAVEEQFYIAWPAIFLVLVRGLRTRVLMTALIIAAIAVTVWRTVLWSGGASEVRLYLLTDTRVDALMIGAALGIATKKFPRVRLLAPRFALLLPPSLLALLVLADLGSSGSPLQSPGWLLGPGMIAVSVLSALIIWITIDAPPIAIKRLLSSQLMTEMGKRSYGIYLFHLPMYAWLSTRKGGFALSLLATLIATELSYRLVEQPLLRRTPRWARRSPLAST